MRHAIVLLKTPELPSAAAILESLEGIAPTVASRVCVRETRSPEVAALSIDRLGELVVGLVAGEVPEGEAEAAAPFSVSALGTGWTVGEYAAHAVVAFDVQEGVLPVLEELRLFTFLLAAVVDASESVAVYWGAARATHEPEFFVRVARADKMLPLMLWSGAAIAEDGPGRVKVLSLGMDQLALSDLLLHAPLEARPEPLDLFFDLLSACALRGVVPSSGESIALPAETAETPIPVSHVPSPTNSERQVWSVVVP